MLIIPVQVFAPSLAISAAILATAQGHSPLHVAPAWAWVLTMAQIAGMWMVGKAKPHGWIVGAAAQPGWITYAILSGQYGFIPGCAVSLIVQILNFSRREVAFNHEAGSDRRIARSLRSVIDRWGRK